MNDDCRSTSDVQDWNGTTAVNPWGWPKEQIQYTMALFRCAARQAVKILDGILAPLSDSLEVVIERMQALLEEWESVPIPVDLPRAVMLGPRLVTRRGYKMALARHRTYPDVRPFTLSARLSHHTLPKVKLKRF